MLWRPWIAAVLQTGVNVGIIVAMVLGWLIMGEHFTPYILAGAAVVLASIVLVTGAKSHQAAKDGAILEEQLPACETTGD